MVAAVLLPAPLMSKYLNVSIQKFSVPNTVVSNAIVKSIRLNRIKIYFPELECSTIRRPEVRRNEFYSFTLKELDHQTCPVRPFELSSIQQLIFPKVA